MEQFVSTYYSLKEEFKTLIHKTSQNQIKNAINQILFNQHLDSFEIIEWGQLTDYAEIQDNLLAVQANFIKDSVKELDDIITLMNEFFDKLQLHLTDLDPQLHFASIPDEQAPKYLRVLIDGYAKEIKLKEMIISKLKNFEFIHSPHDCLVTLASMWSSLLYTNDLALTSVEQLLGFELTTVRLANLTE